MNALCSSYAIQHAVKVVEISGWLCTAAAAIALLYVAKRFAGGGR